MTEDHGPIPLYIEHELRELGLIASDNISYDDVPDLRAKRNRDYAYSLPALAENGEPEF